MSARLPDEVVDVIVWLYECGLTQRDICDRLEVGQSSVTKYLQERGVVCSRGRYPQPNGAASPFWKGTAATVDAKRHRAQKAYRLGDCERCERQATDRHHVDGDVGNNEPGNIMRLCRRCHMEIDGRLERNLAGGRQVRVGPMPCSRCERPYKPLRRGLCARCYDVVVRPDRRRKAVV